MKYQQPTFTLPAAPARISQTDWEIAVGLRYPSGRLVRPKKVKPEPEILEDDFECCGCEGCGFDCGCLCS